MLKKIINVIKKYWKRVAIMIALAALGTFLAVNTYKTGFEFGRVIGHCEMACSVLGADFSGFEYEGACQCEQAGGFILNIPIDHSFFD
jgi:hypothetical protein|tara:strand:- start:38 stop:301 length:264 start_codon:yes stop_codon:yes gene_type:complete